MTLYEEQIIDGVLCWRMSPRDCKGYGDWIQKTPQELTALVLELRQRQVAAPVVVPLPYPVLAPQPTWAPQQPLQPPWTITCGGAQ